MIIGQPEITEERDDIRLEASIQAESEGVEVPHKLWFKIPKQHADHVKAWADAFVVGLLPSAMNVGERIRVEAKISPKLAFGLKQYQHMQNLWYPHQFARIEVEPSGFEARPASGSKAVGVAFSGGIDSSYTLWKRLAENEPIPGFQITHALVINGFDRDIDLNFEGHFSKLRENYEPMLNDHGVEFVTVRTNLRRFRDVLKKRRTGLEKSYGVALSAVALACGGFFSRMYIPGSAQLPRHTQHPEGTHILLDSHLSNECVDFIHDGADVSRVEKTLAIASWPAMHDRLRVCFGDPKFNEATGRPENCGHCEKCVRTMSALEAAGELHKFKTFIEPFNLERVRNTRLRSKSAQLFGHENLELAKKMNRPDLVEAIHHAIQQSVEKPPAPRNIWLRRLRRFFSLRWLSS